MITGAVVFGCGALFGAIFALWGVSVGSDMNAKKD